MVAQAEASAREAGAPGTRRFCACRGGKRERGRVEGPRGCVPYHAVTGNSTDDLPGSCSSQREAAYGAKCMERAT